MSLYGDKLGVHFYHVLVITGFYAFSWAIGFLSLFSPGGVGITEITLSYLLSFFMPLSLASSVAILYRFFLTISELLLFTVALKLTNQARKSHK